jgi:hypothetical protein
VCAVCITQQKALSERERVREREDFSRNPKYTSSKKRKGKEKRRKKEGLLEAPPEKRRTLSFCENRVLSFLTKEEEGRERARTHTERECVCE